MNKKPEGVSTRGKTADNRLRRVDNFMLLYEPALLTRADGPFAQSMFVDLGYGFDPRTTLESAARFRKINPDLKILGVEIDKERVEAALPFADEKTLFRLGGFNLPLENGETVRLIRAFNVLRQYQEKDFVSAYDRLAEYVLPGGLMIEGTSTPFGSVWAANLVRRVESAQWSLEALVFSTNFHTGFDVEEFQTILPKNYIHRVVKGEPIFDFFEAWKRSAAETAFAKAFGLKQWFAASIDALSQKGFEVDCRKKWLSKGYLIWYL
ncbi:MAG: methylase [Chloroflexi bacterium]|nr:methylase [Chloroflexota bacterium]